MTTTQTTRRIHRAIASGAAVAVTLAGSAALGGDAHAATRTPYQQLPAPSKQVVRMVNQERIAHSRAKLRVKEDLTLVAQRWTQKMADSGTLAHNPRLTKQVKGWRYVGENVGYGPDNPTVQAAFMQSPGHRANILDRDYSQIGVGTVLQGDRIWVTQVFRRPAR